MLGNRVNFLLLSAAVISWLLCGCLSDSKDKIKPPRKKLPEKKYVVKEPEKPKQTPKVKPVSDKKTVKKPVQEKTANEEKPKVREVKPKFRNINKVVLNGIDGNGFLDNINFVTRWNILGPFPYTPDKTSANPNKAILHKKLFSEEKKLKGTERAGKFKWQLARFESKSKPGEINLRKFFTDKNKFSLAYAVTYLYCDKDMSNLTLYTGSSGYIKVWLNHQLVHAFDHNKRKGKWDQDVIKNVKLHKGYNLVVIKSVAVDNDWNFYLRLADNENLPMKFYPVKEGAKK